MERLKISELHASVLPRRRAWENRETTPIQIALGNVYPFVVIQGHHELASRLARGTEEIEPDEFTIVVNPRADEFAEINVQSGCATMDDFTRSCQEGNF